MIYMKNITIEETLASSDIDTALTYSPYLIYSEILEGARRPLVFLQVVQEIKDLQGISGDSMKFLKSSQLSATKSNEAAMLAGMTASDKSFSTITVTVGDIIWAAVQLSDFLLENYPEQNFPQHMLQNMGQALTEYLDAYVYATIDAAVGTLSHNCASLDYDELIDALTTCKEADWSPNPANPPYLICSPATVGELLKDDTFVSSARYTTAQISMMVEGEQGVYAGMKVLETSLLTGTGDGFIVFPNNQNGIVVGLIYKRDMRSVSERYEKYGTTYMNSSVRAEPIVVQAQGILKIQINSSP
jgi:hypothetical protein